jgi:LysR family cyn operon transcriptional activator
MKSNDRNSSDVPDLDASRVDLNKLRTFFVIAEQGGVSAAASRLALSRSAVSHSLAALESSLGVLLFDRVGKRLVLTREGSLLRRAYGDAEGRIGEALDAIGQEASEVRGWIRLGLYPGFSRFRLAGLLGRFLAEHAGARCRLVHGSRSELLAGLLEGRLDFALSLRPHDPAVASRVRSTRLFEQSLVLAVSPSLRPRARGVDAIHALPLVDYFRSEPLIDRWISHHYGRRSRRASRDNVRAWVGSGTDLALELCCRGVGACVLPLDLVAPYRKRGELRVIRGPKAALQDGIWLNQLAGTRTSPIQSAFQEALL